MIRANCRPIGYFRSRKPPGNALILAGVRESMSLAVVAPLAILALPIYAFLFGPVTGVLHIAYCSAWSLIMIEALLWRFEKPFACSYSPGKVPVVALLCGYFVAFMAYTDLLAWIESYLLRGRLAAVTCLTLLHGAAVRFDRVSRTHAGGRYNPAFPGGTRASGPDARFMGMTCD